MPFLTTRPTSRMRPIADDDIQSVPVRSSRPNAPASDSGGRKNDQHRRQEPAELDDEDEEDERGGDREDRQQLAERLPLRGILTADLGRVADRQLQAWQLRLDLGDGAPEIAALEPPGHERHLSQVLALEDDLALARAGRREAGKRNGPSVARRAPASRPAGPDSGGTHPGSERAPESCGPQAVAPFGRCRARRPRAAMTPAPR